ncbi:MAG: vgr related protein [Proteobacteria bacterium]|nr:vgr related protein [Pseudomonadota bacterium]
MASPMLPWERRAITSGEIALGRDLFGDAIQWDAVRVLQAPPLPFGAVVPLGKTIVFARWRAVRDFASAPLNEQGWFVHELTHVWQAAQGRVLAVAKFGALGKKAYVYAPRPGAGLKDYNIESQAEIVRHLFLARAGRPEAGAPGAAWLEEIWAKR